MSLPESQVLTISTIELLKHTIVSSNNWLSKSDGHLRAWESDGVIGKNPTQNTTDFESEDEDDELNGYEDFFDPPSTQAQLEMFMREQRALQDDLETYNDSTKFNRRTWKKRKYLEI